MDKNGRDEKAIQSCTKSRPQEGLTEKFPIPPEKMKKKVFYPAFGCEQHLKDGQNTQQLFPKQFYFFFSNKFLAVCFLSLFLYEAIHKLRNSLKGGRGVAIL